MASRTDAYWIIRAHLPTSVIADTMEVIRVVARGMPANRPARFTLTCFLRRLTEGHAAGDRETTAAFLATIALGDHKAVWAFVAAHGRPTACELAHDKHAAALERVREAEVRVCLVRGQLNRAEERARKAGYRLDSAKAALDRTS